MPEDLIELSYDDIDGAVGELAALSGVPVTDLWAAVREQASGQRDVDSLAYGISVVADAIEQANGVSLAADISAEERRSLASRGQALSDGSYPIPDKAHLHSAAVLAASGHGNVAAAKRLIRKRAKELGVSLDSLPGFGSSSDSGNDGDRDDGTVAASMVGQYIDRYGPESYYNLTGEPVGSAEGHTVALTDTVGNGYRWDQTDPVDSYILQLATDASSDRTARMFGLARSDNYSDQPGPPGTGGPEEIIARNQRLLGIEPHGPRDGRGHAAAGCDDPDCTVDHNQPRHPNTVHPEVQRYLDMAAAKMGNAERPAEQSHSYKPLSPAERERARRAARPGHTGYR
jgi:hypothetical protein